MKDLNYDINTQVIMKKGHPCGANLWEVVRLGADIKIKCLRRNTLDIYNIWNCNMVVKSCNCIFYVWKNGFIKSTKYIHIYIKFFCDDYNGTCDSLFYGNVNKKGKYD